MNEKNLLDKMSLIDVDYVEEAAYPKVHKCETAKNRMRRKTAVAAAVLFFIGMGSICFCSQTTAVAGNPFFKSIILFGDNKIEEKMGVVKIKEVAPEAWDVNYNTLDEVEDLLGISLLKSSKTYNAPVPCVEIERSFDGKVINITNRSYYIYNATVVSIGDGKTVYNDNVFSGTVYKRNSDDDYIISYSANFFGRLDTKDETFDGVNEFINDYGNAVFIENYTTANNLNATIILDYGEYKAFIYHDNIKYTIIMQALCGIGDKETFEKYLDTIS